MLMEADLPNDVEALRALVLEQSRTLATERAARADLALAKGEADAEIERLQSIIEAFMRHRFGRKSEQLDPDQLQLGLEDVETALGQARAAREAVTAWSRWAFENYVRRARGRSTLEVCVAVRASA